MLKAARERDTRKRHGTGRERAATEGGKYPPNARKRAWTDKKAGVISHRNREKEAGEQEGLKEDKERIGRQGTEAGDLALRRPGDEKGGETKETGGGMGRMDYRSYSTMKCPINTGNKGLRTQLCLRPGRQNTRREREAAGKDMTSACSLDNITSVYLHDTSLSHTFITSLTSLYSFFILGRLGIKLCRPGIEHDASDRLLKKRKRTAASS